IAKEKLLEIVGTLTERRPLIDVGAGNGVVTAMLRPLFDETLAIEPNDALGKKLRRQCPGITVLDKTIDNIHLSPCADLILCSHVLYYIDRGHWLATVEKLTSWLTPEGCLVLVLQNPHTDCMT